jgi:polyphosphate glucokinase
MMQRCRLSAATRVERCLFLGLGTAMIVDGIVEPMELGHLPYKKGTYEDYVGNRGLDRVGKKRWRKLVEDVVERLVAALEAQDVVIGGGNVIHVKKLPRGCRAGNNAHAFIGAFRMWNDAHGTIRRPRKKTGQFVSRNGAHEFEDCGPTSQHSFIPTKMSEVGRCC